MRSPSGSEIAARAPHTRTVHTKSVESRRERLLLLTLSATALNMTATDTISPMEFEHFLTELNRLPDNEKCICRRAPRNKGKLAGGMVSCSFYLKLDSLIIAEYRVLMRWCHGTETRRHPCRRRRRLQSSNG